MEAACVVGLSDVVARLLACRRRYVDDGLVRPSVALVGLGVGRGLYDDASPQVPVPSSWTGVTGSPLTHVMQSPGSVGSLLKPHVWQVSWHSQPIATSGSEKHVAGCASPKA